MSNNTPANDHSPDAGKMVATPADRNRALANRLAHCDCGIRTPEEDSNAHGWECKYRFLSERDELKAELNRQRQRMNAEMTELRAENAEYRDTLAHIVEYWNRSENDKAMADALYHIIEEADAALAKHAE